MNADETGQDAPNSNDAVLVCKWKPVGRLETPRCWYHLTAYIEVYLHIGKNEPQVVENNIKLGTSMVKVSLFPTAHLRRCQIAIPWCLSTRSSRKWVKLDGEVASHCG